MLILIIIIILLLSTSYALAFKNDFPSELVWRTYVFFVAIFILKNLGLVLGTLISSLSGVI